MNTRDALIMVLDHVDWPAPVHACAPWQPVCEVLPQEVIKQARKALDESENADLNHKLRASIKRNADKMRAQT